MFQNKKQSKNLTLNLRSCPICRLESAGSRPFLERHFEDSRLNSFSFSSRKFPEFMCHRLVQCLGCDLVYATEPPDQSELLEAYKIAGFDSSNEAEDAASDYERIVAPILDRLKNRETALEIGAGTGVFLDVLRKNGFKTVIGVEPSLAAIEAAPLHRRTQLRQTIFKGHDYVPESFDLICCFMTLEHVLDPKGLVTDAIDLLKPGGAIVLVTHNYRAPLNQLLGQRSPIIDIEHLQLFSPKSIRALLETTGYSSVVVSSFHNRYALKYWIRLLPLDLSIKKSFIQALKIAKLADVKISLKVGNILSYGYRLDP